MEKEREGEKEEEEVKERKKGREKKSSFTPQMVAMVAKLPGAGSG